MCFIPETKTIWFWSINDSLILANGYHHLMPQLRNCEAEFWDCFKMILGYTKVNITKQDTDLQRPKAAEERLVVVIRQCFHMFYWLNDFIKLLLLLLKITDFDCFKAKILNVHCCFPSCLMRWDYWAVILLVCFTIAFVFSTSDMIANSLLCYFALTVNAALTITVWNLFWAKQDVTSPY